MKVVKLEDSFVREICPNPELVSSLVKMLASLVGPECLPQKEECAVLFAHFDIT